MKEYINVLFCPINEESRFTDIDPNLYKTFIEKGMLDIISLADDGLSLIYDSDARQHDDAKINPHIYSPLHDVFGFGVYGSYIFANTDVNGEFIPFTEFQNRALVNYVEYGKKETKKILVQLMIADEERDNKYKSTILQKARMKGNI